MVLAPRVRCGVEVVALVDILPNDAHMLAELLSHRIVALPSGHEKAKPVGVTTLFASFEKSVASTNVCNMALHSGKDLSSKQQVGAVSSSNGTSSG